VTAEQDSQDVQRVIEGNVDAFEGIVQRWQQPLIHLAYRFCNDRAMAEEMAQEAFLKAFRSLKQWRGEGRFSTWLFAVATNVYRSHLRRKRLPRIPLETLEEIASQRFDQQDLEERERSRLVRDAVRGLPPKYRDAISLFYFHEMNLSQAALSLGLSEGTLKSHLHRARKLLEKHLGSILEEAGGGEEAAA